MTTTIELRIDVTDAVGLGPAEVAATVHLPAAADLPARPVVAFGFPGGGYCRRYFAMDLPDWPAGGEAAWHCQRGWVFVAIDHLQFGDSTVFEPDVLTFEHISLGNKAAVQHVLARLADGSLTDALPAIAEPFTVGIGQSMGGCFTIVAQGQHQLFDAVAILGYSAIHTVVPSRPGTPNMPMPWITRASYPAAPTIVNPQVLAGGPAITDPDSLAEAVTEQEHVWTWAFHHDDEARDLVALDMNAMSGGPVPSWRSATSAACGIVMVAPGAVATEAAAITVPVFVGVGEQDVVPDPAMEPKAYKSSPDITVFRCERMAHMHNFAPTRVSLWHRVHAWAQGLADSAQP
ncbi:MAG: hypothetical protein Q7V88_01385 [Actinomycetota bacterium]|nr:hypothetical protein [Actinomycetota bacterium]